MWGRYSNLIAGAVLACTATPALAETMLEFGRKPSLSGQMPGGPNGPDLQCVPYARQVSGINIYGDAHTWWGQAAGRYQRGSKPRVGAVMAFQPHGNMELGHVAAVSRIVDSRTVLLRHSNWSPINGRRGQIEDDVRAVDVSANNDWSQVRVWYDPIDGLGTTAWPVEGFIYNERPGAVLTSAKAERKPQSAAPKAKRDIIGDIIAGNSRK